MSLVTLSFKSAHILFNFDTYHIGPSKFNILWLCDSFGWGFCSYRNHFKLLWWMLCNPTVLGKSSALFTQEPAFIKLIHTLWCVFMHTHFVFWRKFLHVGEGREGKPSPGLSVDDDYNWDTKTSAGLKAPAVGHAEQSHTKLSVRKLRRPVSLDQTVKNSGKTKYCYPHWHLTTTKDLIKYTCFRKISFSFPLFLSLSVVK